MDSLNSLISVNFFFSGIAFIVLIGAIFNLCKVLARRAWPTTVGHIERNEALTVTSSPFSLMRLDPASSFSPSSNYGTNKEKTLGLSYVYVIDGRKYIGNQLYSAPIMRVRQKIGGIKFGNKVRVFFNPNRPQMSFLAHSSIWPSLFLLLVGLLIFCTYWYL